MRIFIFPWAHGLKAEKIMGTRTNYYQSVAYSPVPDAAAATVHVEIEERNPPASLSQRIFAWLALIMCLITGAGIIPVFKGMINSGITPCLACSWRSQCMCLFLFPLTYVESRFFSKYLINWNEVIPSSKVKLWVHILMASVAWCFNIILIALALKYATPVRAAVLDDCHPLMMVFYLHCFMHMPVSRLEWLGVLIAIIGIVSSELITSSAGDSSNNHDLILGDVICLLAAAGEVVVIINRSELKNYVPMMKVSLYCLTCIECLINMSITLHFSVCVVQYTAISTIIVAVLSSFLAVAVDGSEIFCTEDKCVFGWASPHRRVNMLVFGFLVGVFYAAGFNFALQYISPLVFSTAVLIDPALTGFLSWIGGLGFPDIVTIVGGLIVLLGVGCIIVGEHQRTHQTG